MLERNMFRISVKCPYCNNNNTNNWYDYIVGEDCDENRSMGTEIEYMIECEEYECEVCHKPFSVKGSVYEYPEGAYNDETLEGYPLEEDSDEF